MWLRTQLLRKRVPLCVLSSCFFTFCQLFVMIWRLVQIQYSFSYCQFKFLVSHRSVAVVGKPSFCLQAKTWFAKVNMRQKELELTVGKGVLNLYKSPNHHKKLAEGEKLEKSTQRGTVPCNSCVPSHILFSFIFLPFTFLILLFIFSATVSACLRKNANKQKQWLKKWTIGLKMRTVERQMRTECE